MIKALFIWSYYHINVVTETRSKQQSSWGLDEQGLQLGREIRNYPVTGKNYSQSDPVPVLEQNLKKGVQLLFVCPWMC